MRFIGFLLLFATVMGLNLNRRPVNGVIFDLVESDMGFDTDLAVDTMKVHKMIYTCPMTTTIVVTVTETSATAPLPLHLCHCTSATANPTSTINGNPGTPGATANPEITGTGSMDGFSSIFLTTGSDVDISSAHELSVSFAHESTMTSSQNTSCHATTPIWSLPTATSTSGASTKTDDDNRGKFFVHMIAWLVVAVIGVGI